MSRPPLPPFSEESAVQKVRAAEDAWNTRDPASVALAYTLDSRWRNRGEFPRGRAQIDHHSTYLRAWLNQAGISAIDELRFQPTLLTSDAAGDLERAKQDAVRLARAHARIQTAKPGAIQ